MTFLTTSEEICLAPLPELYPSAITTDKPPFGRSTTSTESPLSDVAYLLIFATAKRISILTLYNNNLKADDQFASVIGILF